jgi:outer membrane immunogenic protein
MRVTLVRIPAGIWRPLVAGVALAAFVPLGAQAESGLYVGGSVGSVTIEADIPDENLDEVFQFDESDFAWKAFAGFNFDLTLVDLAIEGGYVDLGAPSGVIGDTDLELDVSGWDIFGLVGLQLGPIGAFAKAGVINWDTEATVGGVGSGDDDGTDPAYGIGARFNLGSFEIRGEYEMFDLDNVDDVFMLSAGVAWSF